MILVRCQRRAPGTSLLDGGHAREPWGPAIPGDRAEPRSKHGIRTRWVCKGGKKVYTKKKASSPSSRTGKPVPRMQGPPLTGGQHRLRA